MGSIRLLSCCFFIIHMGKTISLTEQQRKRAFEMLNKLDSTSKPKDFVSEWKATPDRIGREWDDLGERYVQVDEIVGTEPQNVERLEPKRLIDIIKKLTRGKFVKEHRYPPALCEVNGEYFVDADGNHRVLAFKYIGINRIYGEVLRYY